MQKASRSDKKQHWVNVSWNAVPVLRKTQVLAQVLHCSGVLGSALGNTWGELSAQVMVAEPGPQYVQDVADGVQKQTGWRAAGTLVMKLTGAPDSSLILLGCVPECVFTFFFFPLRIRKWKPAKLLDKCLFNFLFSFEFQIAIFRYLNWCFN